MRTLSCPISCGVTLLTSINSYGYQEQLLLLAERLNTPFVMWSDAQYSSGHDFYVWLRKFVKGTKGKLYCSRRKLNLNSGNYIYVFVWEVPPELQTWRQIKMRKNR